MRLDPSTVSRSVTALVAHGLVERRPDPTDSGGAERRPRPVHRRHQGRP
ncbi:MarR family transcriptional regulator [Micromonospora sp. NBC_01638]